MRAVPVPLAFRDPRRGVRSIVLTYTYDKQESGGVTGFGHSTLWDLHSCRPRTVQPRSIASGSTTVGKGVGVGGGGGFSLKPHIEVRFKWMWRDGGCLSERKKRQNGVQVSLPACAHIMVTRARSGCGANKKMAHDQLARFRPSRSSRCRARSRRSAGTRWRFRSA